MGSTPTFALKLCGLPWLEERDRLHIDIDRYLHSSDYAGSDKLLIFLYISGLPSRWWPISPCVLVVSCKHWIRELQPQNGRYIYLLYFFLSFRVFTFSQILTENIAHGNCEVVGSGFFLNSSGNLMMYRDCLQWQWRFFLLQRFYFEKLLLVPAWKLELLRLYLTHQLNLSILHAILCSVRGPLFVSSLLSKSLQ